MDSSPANEKASGTATPASKTSIDSLRTVEFRTTIRGYHMDDVDEYLERVALEAEALQEQVRLSSERLKQAADRMASLEQQLEQARRAQPVAAPAPAPLPVPASEQRIEVADDSLQRTLILAQKFVDQTREEAERDAHALLAKSDERARAIIADAEEHVRVMTEESERNLREEVKRLDSRRSELVSDVETIARHLEVERGRIRKALTDMLAWVDEHVQPPAQGSQSSQLAQGGGVTDAGGARAISRPREDRVEERQSSLERALSSPTQEPRNRPELGGAEPSTSSRGQDDRDDYEPPTITRRPDDASLAGLTGQPTEQVSTADLLSETGANDEVTTGPGDRPATSVLGGGAERAMPTHQRQMFAPGRESHQAGSSAPR